MTLAAILIAADIVENVYAVELSTFDVIKQILMSQTFLPISVGIAVFGICWRRRLRETDTTEIPKWFPFIAELRLGIEAGRAQKARQNGALTGLRAYICMETEADNDPLEGADLDEKRTIRVLFEEINRQMDAEYADLGRVLAVCAAILERCCADTNKRVKLSIEDVLGRIEHAAVQRSDSELSAQTAALRRRLDAAQMYL